MLQLFVVYLGGRAEGCRTELHDVAFAVGDKIEDCHEQLLDAWFGTPDGLHIDSWMAFGHVGGAVDGHWVNLVPAAIAAEQPKDAPKLFFVNMGGYAPGRFMEFHEGYFLVGQTKGEVKTRAKELLSAHLHYLPHADDLIDVDDCVTLEAIGQYRIILEPAPGVKEAVPTNGYFPLPRETIAAWRKKRQLPAASA